MGVSLINPTMPSLRFLSLAVLLALAAPAFAQNQCGDACMGMLREAHTLENQGKYQEALDKYRAAEKAEPLASFPFSSEAALILTLSARVKPELAEEWRKAARAQANRALKLWPDDPIALETLRLLDDAPTPLHAPNPQAASLLAEGELQFSQAHYPEALRKYQAAAQADPAYSVAWVNAGDCYFAQKDWPQAEAMFRRAVEIEPRNSQGWRYLADTLAAQGKLAAAEAALYSAIAADPSQRPNWTKLASLRAHQGKPLKPLALRRGVRVSQGADGKYTVNLDEWAAKQADTPDFAMRVMLGADEAKLRSDDKAGTKSAYEIELQAWRDTLKVADELKASTGKDPADPALQRMQALARDGQLEPAILLLQFRQAYRPALEAWLAANPDGVKTFVERYGVTP